MDMTMTNILYMDWFSILRSLLADHTRVDNSCMLWLLKLALVFPAKTLKSRVAVGMWDGDTIFPLFKVLWWLGIIDKSGRMEAISDRFDFLCYNVKHSLQQQQKINRLVVTYTLYENIVNLVFTLCQTIILWSMAFPHRTIPTLIRILVVMAGVEGNWRMVYRTISENMKLFHLDNEVLPNCFFFLIEIETDL